MLSSVPEYAVHAIFSDVLLLSRVRDLSLIHILDSLTELTGIDKVQISINGDTSGKCRYTYKLSKMYKADDLSLIHILFCEVNESMKAYGVTTHRHTPEIEEQLGYAAGKEITVNFTCLLYTSRCV